MHSWVEAQAGPLRLVEKETQKTDREPKALSCYGLLRADSEQIWLRFVKERPVSSVTTKFLEWVCEKLGEEGKKVLVLIWDNAKWHVSRAVRQWIREHNRKAKREGGVRIIESRLPVKSPWLNRIEPHWMHGKKAVAEPERKLTGEELMTRVTQYYKCPELPMLSKDVV